MLRTGFLIREGTDAFPLRRASCTFQMMFSSPSSAKGNLDAEPLPEPRGRRERTPPKRPPVAPQLKVGVQATARAIAYAAVQLLHRPPRHSCFYLYISLPVTFPTG